MKYRSHRSSCSRLAATAVIAVFAMLATAGVNDAVALVFQQAAGSTYGVSEASTTRDFRVADMNGEGRDDIIVASKEKVFLLPADPNGWMQGPVELVSPDWEIESVVPVDLNNDGKTDLVTSHLGTVRIFLATGNLAPADRADCRKPVEPATLETRAVAVGRR